MLLNLIPRESESASLLLKLIQSKSWAEATNRAITHPEEAELSITSSSTTISSFTSISSSSCISNVLSLALRTGAPLSTIRALIDANPDLLFKANQGESSNSNSYYNAPFRRAFGTHSTPGYGTILHDGIKYRAVSMEALLYVIDQVVTLERERLWISRGELKPATLNFRNAIRTRSSNDNEADFENENNDENKRSFVDSNYEKQKQEQNSFRIQGGYSQQRELYTHSTLFNQTDDLGRTPLHCIIHRACCHSSINDSNSSTTDNNSTKGNIICCENVMMVIKAIVKAFPPAVAKVDSDGHSPLDMVLMTSSPVIDEMEVELKVFELVRIMLRAYPYAASSSINSIKAGNFISFTSPSMSPKLGINTSPPIKSRRLLVTANSTNTTMLTNNFASVRRYRGVLLADCNRRSYLNRVINGKVGGENPLSYALTYGRSASTIRLLLECSDSIGNSNSWHTGLLHNCDNNNESNCNSHLSNSKNEIGYNHILTNDESCMAIINNNFEVPLHIAISMRAPTDVVELVLKSGPDAAGVPDRCNLSPICWAWIRFVIDCTSDPNTMNQEFGDVDVSSNPSSRHGAEVSFILPPIKISKRRFIPPGYIQLHETITKRVIFHVYNYLLETQKETRNEMIAGPRKQTQLQSECKEKIGKGFDDFCFKLSILLPSAASSIATNSTSSSVTQLLSSPSSASGTHSQTFKPSSSIYDRWLLLHAACLLNCPRSVLYTALLLTFTSSKISGNQLNQKDIYGNLPIHYAASRPGYSQLSVPVGVTQMPQRVVEPSIVFDILPLFKEGARVTNGRGQLPLHLAIEEEKIEIGIFEEEKILSGFQNAGRLSRRANFFDDADSIDFYGCNGRKESRFRSPLMYIMSAYSEALERRDGITKLFPFMQAAVGRHSNINTIYSLLKENPALVGIGDSS